VIARIGYPTADILVEVYANSSRQDVIQITFAHLSNSHLFSRSALPGGTRIGPGCTFISIDEGWINIGVVL
jgi:hypothetical protein